MSEQILRHTSPLGAICVRFQNLKLSLKY